MTDSAQRTPIANSINLDSIRECLKLAGHASQGLDQDLAFPRVVDRFLALAKEYAAPLSIYVIGRDLEDPRNVESVAPWRELGHEIGNHSHSHRQDLGRLSGAESTIRRLRPAGSCWSPHSPFCAARMAPEA